MIDPQLSFDRNGLVEASAGTGKTFAIETIVADVITSGQASIDQVLVVTFTERATAELVRRLRERLEQIEGDAKQPEEQRGHARRALDAFEHAAISTIHGFCNSVLSDLAFAAGEPFDQNLVSADDVLHRAFRDVLRTRLVSDAGCRAHLEHWLEYKTIAALESALIQAHGRRFTEAAAVANASIGPDLAALKLAFDAETVRADLKPVNKSKTRTAAFELVDKLESLLEHPVDEVLRALRDDRPAFMNRKVGGWDPCASTNAFKDQLDRFVRRHVDPWTPLHDVVQAFLPLVERRAAALKSEENVLDYADMLRRLAAALDGPHGAALTEGIRARHRVALVDEFQDTDDLQWSIFWRVFGASDAHRLICVGDPKQAIYAFRGADVFAYLGAKQTFEAEGARSVELEQNWRSTEDLIVACNKIFDQGATPSLFEGPIRYGTPAVACPTPPIATSAGQPITPVTILAYPATEDPPAIAEVRSALGRVIGSTIRDLIENPAARIDIEHNGETRPVRLSDIFVLTRTNAESSEIGKHLSAAGVPYAFYKQGGLFSTMEADQVSDLIAALADPGDRQARTRVFATPFFAVPWAQLPDTLDLADDHPLMARLLGWSGLVRGGTSLPRALRRILDESGVLERTLLTDETERARTNFIHLFELLIEASQGSRGTIDGLVARFAAWISGGGPAGEDGDAQRLESERDAVRVMTIHKAKGLEADVVFLFGSFSAFSGSDHVVLYHDEAERRVFVPKGPRKWWPNSIRAQFNEEGQQEDQRLMYVALTRARAKLFLPFLPHRKKATGAYRAVNERLAAMIDEGLPEGFERVELRNVRTTIDRDTADVTAAIQVADEAIGPPPGDDATRDRVRQTHPAWRQTSYSTRKRGHYVAPPADARSKSVPELSGKHGGLCLHDILELLPLESLDEAGADYEQWVAREDVEKVCRARMARRGVAECALEHVKRLVFQALTMSIAVPDESPIDGLWRAAPIREMDFDYPIPETSHPLLARGDRGELWPIRRGVVTGSIDLVFRHNDRVWFADWKSDAIDGSNAVAVANHVAANYADQALLYTLALVRAYGIADEAAYAARFGGYLYVFVRDGSVFTDRPSWQDVVAFEQRVEQLPYALHASGEAP